MFLLSLALACTLHKSEKPGVSAGTGSDTGKVRFAKGFIIQTAGRSMILKVKDPWQQASKVNYTYQLTDTVYSSRILSDHETCIRIPVKKVVCLSTTHIGFIDCLDEISSISGISGRNYVVNKKLRDRISSNLVADVGYEENLNYEKLVQLNPDVVFVYGISGAATAMVKKINELGIPAVFIAEYLEEEPLAKTEWIKFFGAFFKKDDLAASLFDTIAGLYGHYAEIAGHAAEKPAVMLGLPWKGTWYISGGKSYVAELIRDAGARYIWTDLDFKDSRPVDLEKVFERALTADYWLNSGDARTREDILQCDARFAKLPAYIHESIYNNNRLLSPTGGNAFYESGVVEPHIILSDLIAILHPQLLPSHKLKYYQKLQ
jgi:iron complex transport system substrate-binding protein